MVLEEDCPDRALIRKTKYWFLAIALGLLVSISDVQLPGDPGHPEQGFPETGVGLFATSEFFTGEVEQARGAELPTTAFYAPGEPVLLPYDRIIHEAAGRYDLDPDLIAAVIMTESQFKPEAISKKGARGLMQIMPDTAEALGLKNIYSPEDNILAGTRHLKWLMSRFDSDVPLALAAYNAGEQSVLTHKGIPPYPETRAYVLKVMAYYRAIKDASIPF
jgi:soluble lytic murein transglycosylase-like protein